MMKFNKSLLAAAVVTVLAVPSLGSAATLDYVPGTQISYAKDLIVNNGTTIYTPNSLLLSATGSDTANMATVTAGTNVTVKVTLTKGARFDTTAAAAALVAGFTTGAQFGAGPLVVVGTPYYSTSGQELNFTFTAAAAGNTAPGYALELNSMQVTNLVDGLFLSNNIGAEITAQNSVGQQILAAKQTIALSQWGVTVRDVASPDLTKTIDVGSNPRKTLFAPTGAVGGSGVPGDSFFNAGGFELDISKAVPAGGGVASYVNNFDAVAANPQYNVVATAIVDVTVTGTNLSAFTGTRVWLDSNPACAHAAGSSTNGSVVGGVANFASPATSAMWASVTAASPGPSTAFVCFGANNIAEMLPQDLSGSVRVFYNLSTQRMDPPAMDFSLLPLRLNGSTLIFQNVNPAGNATAQSFVRMTNNNNQVCPVTIDAKDDAGLHSGDVKVVLGPHQSMQLNSEHLEGVLAKAGLTGGFGDGSGKWYIRVTAECSNFKASALNRHQDGVVTNLTPEKFIGSEWLTPPNSL